MNDSTKLGLQIVLPILILAGAGALTATLVLNRKSPDRAPPEQRALLVETQTVHRSEHRLDVHASGTVEAARTVTIQPQVSGRVEHVHDSLEPGGLVGRDDILVQIDRSDYKLALDQRKTALEQAKAQLALERGQQEIAEREWNIFKNEADDLSAQGDASLALREPQLASANAQVDSARSQVEQAKQNLARTTVRAPFDGMVQEESVSVGDLASPQSPLATLVASDLFWARLQLPPDKIPYIDIPNVNANQGSDVTIQYDLGERLVERKGEVIRLVGDLDRVGRLARIIVAIDDPLGRKRSASEDRGNAESESQHRGNPLFLNAYVDARIQGNTTRNLVELPRDAVRNGDQAYLFDDGTLAIKKLDIVWERPTTVLVDSGLDDGDRIIVGPMPEPIEGMPVRTESDSASSEQGQKDNAPRDDTTGNDASEPPAPDDKRPRRDDGPDQ